MRHGLRPLPLPGLWQEPGGAFRNSPAGHTGGAAFQFAAKTGDGFHEKRDKGLDPG